MRVYFTSDCVNSLRRSLKLSNTLLNPPLAPASITMTQSGSTKWRLNSGEIPVGLWIRIKQNHEIIQYDKNGMSSNIKAKCAVC